MHLPVLLIIAIGNLKMKLDNRKIISVDIYIENRKTRTFAGRLTRFESGFRFEYDNKYLHEKTAISFGPDLPLTRRMFESETLFESLKDRIPSKQNPAYKDYCDHFDIDVNESDELILLSTIGSKGASNFVLEPVYENNFNVGVLSKYRKKLQLTVRNFAALFDFAPYTISKIEKNHTSGRDILKRLEIYINFPEVALFEIKRNKAKVHSDVFEKTVSIIICRNMYYEKKTSPK